MSERKKPLRVKVMKLEGVLLRKEGKRWGEEREEGGKRGIYTFWKEERAECERANEGRRQRKLGNP